MIDDNILISSESTHHRLLQEQVHGKLQLCWAYWKKAMQAWSSILKPVSSDCAILIAVSMLASGVNPTWSSELTMDLSNPWMLLRSMRFWVVESSLWWLFVFDFFDGWLETPFNLHFPVLLLLFTEWLECLECSHCHLMGKRKRDRWQRWWRVRRQQWRDRQWWWRDRWW